MPGIQDTRYEIRNARPKSRAPLSIIRFLACVLFLLSGTSLLTAQTERKALVLTIKDAIGPATSDYVHNGLERAGELNAGLVVIRLDTPGGLDTSMRDIIRDILASPIPVAIYVAPSGARAASAGTYMLYAAHIAAMSPGTNLGAATPVQIGGLPDLTPKTAPEKKDEKSDKDGAEDKEAPGTEGTDREMEAAEKEIPADAMSKKMVNDAVAYIRSLAEMRGRNADWGEKAVRQAASLSSEQALDQGVIDILAKDLQDLMTQIDNRVVSVNNREHTLQTAGLDLEYYEPDWRNEFLSVITNPNVAYILMLLGIYGLFFELANPGFVLPGVIGGICLLLALYSLQVLPVNYAGLALILLGITFMIAELFMPSFGALGIGGIVSFVIGSIILFDVEGGNIAISIPLIIAVSILSAAFFLVALRSVIRAHRKPVVTGSEEISAGIGEALADIDSTGHIYIHGETWLARTSAPLKRGDRVRVTGREGLTLKVEPLEEK